jgi:hypothetical protein
MIDKAVQVVPCLNVVFLQEFLVRYKLTNVQISVWEVHIGLHFAEENANLPETFELNNQDGRWSENLKFFLVYCIFIALGALHLIFKDFRTMKFVQAIIKARVVRGFVVQFLFDRRMFNDFICQGVVVLLQDA